MGELILKENLRQQMKTMLRQMTADQKILQSKLICSYLAKYLDNNVGKWAAFKAMASEPDLSHYEKFKDFCFPVLEKNEMFFGYGLKFEKTNLGFEQPSKPSIVSPVELSGVLVPGLAFSTEGHRLGRGAGFYDRALQDFAGLKIGICFSSQILPVDVKDSKDVSWAEAHDVKMDAILSDQGLLWNKESVWI